jgi:predicted acetyltransferase
MDLDISLATLEEKPILRNLLELYSYDFSAFDGADVNDSGLYGYHGLDRYWEDPDRYPFLIRVGGRLAGFALVRKGTYFPDSDYLSQTPAWLIAEFFVMHKYRRHGVGRIVAKQMFDRFHGRWEIAEMVENEMAQAFWREVVGEHTGGNFTEVSLENDRWRGPVQIFNS